MARDLQTCQVSECGERAITALARRLFIYGFRDFRSVNAGAGVFCSGRQRETGPTLAEALVAHE